MERIKRVLAIMLVLTMLFSLGETMVFASEVPADTSSEVQSDGAASDENTIPGATDEMDDVDPGANSGDGGKVTDGEEVDDGAPAPDGEPSAPPSDVDTEETEATATPEPSATPEPTATAEPTATPEPVHKEWPWTEPGNTIDQLMSGGYNLSAGGSSYYVEGNGVYLDGSLLAQADANSLNLSGGMLYYAAGSSIYRMPAGGGEAETVYTADGPVDQMYVMGEEIRFLSNGVVYSYDMSAAEDEPAPAAEAAEEAPAPADTEDLDIGDVDAEVPADEEETEDAQQPSGESAPEAPQSGFVFNMSDLGLEPTETETAQPTKSAEALDGPAGVIKFMPTPYGNLFLTGEILNYTLSTATTQLSTGVRHCYFDGEWLIVYNSNGDPMQTSLANALNGVMDLQEYSLHQDEYFNVGISDEEIMEQQAEYFASDEYEATLVGREPDYNAEAGIQLANTYTSALKKSDLTVSQRNIVLRAQQMSEVTWTPMKSFYAWGGNDSSYVSGKAKNRGDGAYLKDASGKRSSPDGTFAQGVLYRGVPYSQPVDTGGYVGYNITLSEFLNQVNNPSSKLYTGYSKFANKTAPWYGSDCSAFVSWVWNISRQVCSTLDTYSTYVGKSITNSLQVGDIINNPNSHVMLVTDIGYDEGGNVVAVEITEQTPPKMTVTCYSKDSVKIDDSKRYDYVSSIELLNRNYLSAGYTIFHRRSTLPAVPAPQTVQGIGSVATPTMTVTPVEPGKAEVKFACATEGAEIYYTQNGGQPTVNDTKYDGQAISVDADTANQEANKGRFIFQAIAKKDALTSVAMNAEVNVAVQPKLTLAADGSAAPLSDGIYYVGEDQALSLKAAIGSTIYYTTDGNTPTLQSKNAVSDKASITLELGDVDEVTIKAFAVVDGDIPSKVSEFKVKKGTLWTVTVDDPFGFLTLQGTTMAQDATNKLMASKQYVVNGTKLTIDVKESVKASEKEEESAEFKLDKVVWKKGSDEPKEVEASAGSFEIDKVDANVTITAKVQTDFEDLYEKGDDAHEKYAYFTNAVEYGTTLGLVKGYTEKGQSLFKPHNLVSRKEIVTFLGRLAGPDRMISGEEIEDWESMTFPKLARTMADEVKVRDKADQNAAVVATLSTSGEWLQMDKSKTDINTSTQMPWYYVKYKTDEGSGWGYVASKSSGYSYVQACPFEDFKQDDTDYFAYGYAQWGYLVDIVSGTYLTTFSPNAAINREDLCCLMYKYVTKLLGHKMDTTNRLDEFMDGDSVRSYAREAVNAMVNAGIMNGKSVTVDGRAQLCIAPRGTGLSEKESFGFATRAEAVTMFMRLDKYIKSEILD